MPRLLRLAASNMELLPPGNSRSQAATETRLREPSGLWGFSTFTTSAPRSPNMTPASGPSIQRLHSTTLMPLSGPSFIPDSLRRPLAALPVAALEAPCGPLAAPA